MSMKSVLTWSSAQDIIELVFVGISSNFTIHVIDPVIAVSCQSLMLQRKWLYI